MAKSYFLLLLLVPVIVILTLLYIIYLPPVLLIRYFQHIWPDTLWLAATSKKIVALTIDDAPTDCIDDILDVLEKYKVRATFFIIGTSALGRETNLERMVRSGHELGNHTMEDKPSISLGELELKSQLDEVRRKIIEPAYDAAHREHPPNYFRPGSGFFSSWMRKLAATPPESEYSSTPISENCV